MVGPEILGVSASRDAEHGVRLGYQVTRLESTMGGREGPAPDEF